MLISHWQNDKHSLLQKWGIRKTNWPILTSNCHKTIVIWIKKSNHFKLFVFRIPHFCNKECLSFCQCHINNNYVESPANFIIIIHFITFLNSNNSKTAYPNITTIYIFKIREIWSFVLVENIQGVSFQLRKLLSKFDISNEIWHFWHSPKDNTQKIIQLLYLKFFSNSYLNLCKMPRKYKEWPCTCMRVYVRICVPAF